MCRLRLFIGLLGIVSLISACVYTDYGHHYVEPVPGDPPVVFASTNLDTMYNPVVDDSLEVIYDIDIQNGELYYLDAVVGNSLIQELDTTRGSFWLYPNDAQFPGIDTLSLILYYSSNTNSLGDVLGLESRTTRLKYAIYFN